MRIALLAASLALALGATAHAAGDEVEAFELPPTSEIFPTEPHGFDGLLEDGQLSDDQCAFLVAATQPIPFESTPATVSSLADAYAAAGQAIPALAAATVPAADSLRTAAARGAGRQAMLGIWFDGTGRAAIRELVSIASDDCAAQSWWVALGPPDRLIELVRIDHPQSPRIADIGSWGMSVTGLPRTIHWSFGYAGAEPILVCQELSESIAGAGFAGTHLTVHDDALGGPADLAVGLAGEGCVLS